MLFKTRKHYKVINEVAGQYEITKGVSKKELQTLAENPKVSSLQIANPLSQKEYDNLENIVFSKRPDILLRVYGHYGKICDLNFIKRMLSLRKFSADCLMNAKGIENLKTLRNLEVLGVGIFDLDNFDFLDDINADLEELYIYKTNSKKPSIKAVSRFKKLKYVLLEGQSKGIEELAKLLNLEKIVLQSISTTNLDYLAGLPKLWSVEIKLGGIKNLDALKTLPKLKYLELWQVRGLSDLSFVSELRSLQMISLESLTKVSSFPNTSKLTSLRRVALENMKGLKEIENLRRCIKLEDFIYYSAQNFEPEGIKPVLENPAVQNVSCWFGSDKKNNKFKLMAEQYGKTFGISNFEFI